MLKTKTIYFSTRTLYMKQEKLLKEGFSTKTLSMSFILFKRNLAQYKKITTTDFEKETIFGKLFSHVLFTVT